jgi:hypothetical protein
MVQNLILCSAENGTRQTKCKFYDAGKFHAGVLTFYELQASLMLA